MHKKLIIGNIIAVTALSYGLARAQSAPPSGSAPLTQAEAAKQGISEMQFKVLDTNKDGVLDSRELEASRNTQKKK